jgi:phosphoglycerate-specific signal transduction histidine kinase
MALSIDDLPDDVEKLKALLVAAHAATEAADARATALATEVDRLTERAERLDHIISVLRRAQFRRRSERITDAQIELAL